MSKHKLSLRTAVDCYLSQKCALFNIVDPHPERERWIGETQDRTVIFFVIEQIDTGEEDCSILRFISARRAEVNEKRWYYERIGGQMNRMDEDMSITPYDPDLPPLTEEDFRHLVPFRVGLARMIARRKRWNAERAARKAEAAPGISPTK